MEKEGQLWLEEPPVGVSATGWADAYEAIAVLISDFNDGYGNVSVEDRLAVFVLEDGLRRCGLEAEKREPGILNRRQQAKIDDLRAGFEEFME
jgi:hypothetical protein